MSEEPAINENFNQPREVTYMDNIELRFGIEIEICIRIQDSCLELPTGIKATQEDISKLSFFDKFQIYINSILSKASPELKQLFPEVAIEETNDNIFFKLLDKENIIIKAGTEEDRKFKSYEIPRFMVDTSVECGDNLFPGSKTINRNTGALVEPWKSITIECISPVLKIRGFPTNEKIKAVLLPYLEFIGLIKQDCFMTNSTAGYHVNVSVFDIEKQMVIPLTKYPLLLFVLDEYIKKEREYYTSEFRGNISLFARPLYRMTNLLLKQRPNLRNNKHALVKALTEKSVRLTPGPNNDKNITGSLITKKKIAIKVKPSEILEFRVFKSNKNIDAMIDNVHYSLVIVMNGILNLWTKRDAGGLANLSELFPVVGGRNKTRRNKRRSRKGK